MLKALLRRIGDATRILIFGADASPVTRRDLHELRHEWAEWEVTFTSILEKLNAWSARQAKREKRAIEAGILSPEGQEAVPRAEGAKGLGRKADIYRRAAGAGGQRVDSIRLVPGGTPPAPPSPPPDGDDDP